MNWILESVIFIVVILSMFAGLMFFLIVSGNTLWNERQELECDKMREYGYSSFIQVKEQPIINIKECWIRMEDGANIRSDDYSIADSRKAKINKQDLIQLNDVSTRENE